MLYYNARIKGAKDVTWTEVFITLETLIPVGLDVAHFRIQKGKIVRILVPTLATINL